MDNRQVMSAFGDVTELVSALEAKFDKSRMLPQATQSMMTAGTCGPLCDGGTTRMG